MVIERIYDDDLAQAGYLIGCQASGTAIVVDARRDIQAYLDIAAAQDMRIVAVTETHIHADYLSGTRELANATGAQMYVSDEGGDDWRYGAAFDDAVRMTDGHEIAIGNIRLRALHTPGHTPEHMSFLVTDGALTDRPGFILTGDFVFVGDVGRPDLLDEAAGYHDTRFDGARDLFHSLTDILLTLPDYVQVLPGHGSGSACGKALGSVPASTVGYERRFAWWASYVANGDEEGFVRELLADQPDAPAYFGRMKRQNRLGPPVMGTVDGLTRYSAPELVAALDSGRAVLIDTREPELVRTGTVAGSLNVPGPAQAATYASWIHDPESDDRFLVVLADDERSASDVRDHLVRVGIDTVRGFVTSLDGLPMIRPATVTPSHLDGLDVTAVLDVRTADEYAAGHLPGSRRIAAGRIMWIRDTLPDPADGPVLVYCQTGRRSSVVASALRQAGHEVVELAGGYEE